MVLFLYKTCPLFFAKCYNRFQNYFSIRIIQIGITSSFRMGHHTKYIFFFITNSSYIFYRSIRIRFYIYLTIFITILKPNLFFSDYIFQSYIISIIPSLCMSNWYFVYSFISKTSCIYSFDKYIFIDLLTDLFEDIFKRHF